MWAGTTFGASPPCCDDAVDLFAGPRCWRSSPIATCATVNASPALMPSSGAAAACDSWPVYAHCEVRDRADARRHVLERRRVHHHRRVHAVERAAFEEEHLAAAAFLGRRSDHGDGQTELVDERRERQARRRPPSRR